MSNTDHAEAQVVELLKAASPDGCRERERLGWRAEYAIRCRIAGCKRCEALYLLDDVDSPDALAAALDLARALRAHGDVVEDKGWHHRDCALAYDWSHYQIESPCTCGPDREALAAWGRLTQELSDG